MGNFFGTEKKDDLLLDFGNTADISSTIPYLNKLNADAQTLVGRLNSKAHSQNVGEFNETENYDMYKLFEKTQGLTNDNVSDTSPFISSDLYNDLIKQHGGGDEESTTTTNTATSGNTSGTSTHAKKKGKKKHNKKNVSTESVSVGGADYTSSSAHDSVSTVSVKNKKSHKSRYTESVNTSDINIISVDE